MKDTPTASVLKLQSSLAEDVTLSDVFRATLENIGLAPKQHAYTIAQEALRSHQAEMERFRQSFQERIASNFVTVGQNVVRSALDTIHAQMNIRSVIESMIDVSGTFRAMDLARETFVTRQNRITPGFKVSQRRIAGYLPRPSSDPQPMPLPAQPDAPTMAQTASGLFVPAHFMLPALASDILKVIEAFQVEFKAESDILTPGRQCGYQCTVGTDGRQLVLLCDDVAVVVIAVTSNSQAEFRRTPYAGALNLSDAPRFIGALAKRLRAAFPQAVRFLDHLDDSIVSVVSQAPARGKKTSGSRHSGTFIKLNAVIRARAQAIRSTRSAPAKRKTCESCGTSVDALQKYHRELFDRWDDKTYLPPELPE